MPKAPNTVHDDGSSKEVFHLPEICSIPHRNKMRQLGSDGFVMEVIPWPLHHILGTEGKMDEQTSHNV